MSIFFIALSGVGGVLILLTATGISLFAAVQAWRTKEPILGCLALLGLGLILAIAPIGIAAFMDVASKVTMGYWK